jgi:hypothetical protein
MSEQHFCQSPVDPATWDLYEDRRFCGAPASHHSPAHQVGPFMSLDQWFCDAHWELFSAEAANFNAEKSGLRN